MPGVAVFFEAGHAAAAGGKYFDRRALAVGFDGNNVPDIVGDDVADNKIYVAASVPIFADIAAGVEAVSVEGAGVRGLYLHSPDSAAAVNHEVVAVTLSPGLGHAEAERGGLVQEGGFGYFSAALGGKFCGRRLLWNARRFGL